MTTKKPSYELAEVTCEKKNCNETFSVIISSIYNVVDKPVGEIEIPTSRYNDIADADRIDDYLVIKCACGRSQRVHLRIK